MKICRDFKELLESFNAHRVEYVIVGAHALAFHGAPRFTNDLDVYVRPSAENAARVLAALADFGFGSLDLQAADFENPDNIVQLGVAPVRIDLIMSLGGVSWDQVDAGKVTGRFGDVPVNYIGRDQFIANKKAAGRLKDLADIEAIRKI